MKASFELKISLTFGIRGSQALIALLYRGGKPAEIAICRNQAPITTAAKTTPPSRSLYIVRRWGAAIGVVAFATAGIDAMLMPWYHRPFPRAR